MKNSTEAQGWIGAGKVRARQVAEAVAITIDGMSTQAGVVSVT